MVFIRQLKFCYHRVCFWVLYFLFHYEKGLVLYFGIVQILMISHNLAAKGIGGVGVGSMKTCVEDSAKSSLHPPPNWGIVVKKCETWVHKLISLGPTPPKRPPLHARQRWR